MKKTLPFFLAAALLAGCNKTQQSETTGNDSTATALTAEEPEQEAPFVAPDLQAFFLHGDVKQVRYFMEDYPDYPYMDMQFDQQGRLIAYKIETFDGPDVVEYTYPDDKSLEAQYKDKKTAEETGIDCSMVRDEQGRLTQIPQNVFSYNEQGRVEVWESYGWESMTTHTFTQYTENGDPELASFTGAGEGEEWSGKTSYTYDEVDEHGNWLVCREHTQMNGEKSKETKKRVITYHSDKQ
ncbi:MAG: membrane lipoprotein lipid attachment site-containing protein [Bacteroidales bacterium]|nr:membrane lipoprotein lipid attachment site-containing protein [Candidatus Physcousia equi]